ncbi:hypothetical protein BJX68DRAFT_250004, partial [Aspergillus pseudodeflectus]
MSGLHKLVVQFWSLNHCGVDMLQHLGAMAGISVPLFVVYGGMRVYLSKPREESDSFPRGVPFRLPAEGPNVFYRLDWIEYLGTDGLPPGSIVHGGRNWALSGIVWDLGCAG